MNTQDFVWTASTIQGVGIGLREQHIAEVLRDKPAIPWFELLADNHLATGGLIPHHLAAIREHYPITLHCVAMSLGGTDPLDFAYIGRIKQLSHDFDARWISDHIAFTQCDNRHFHDLLPIPYSEESLKNITQRINIVQDFLGQALLIENPSSYLSYRGATFTEVDFLLQLQQDTQCKLLLDINNIYVSSVNHHFSAIDYLNKIPVLAVQEIHLAGYEQKKNYLLDAHNACIAEPVWNLYRAFAQRCHAQQRSISTLIEWDNNIPALAVLQQEAKKAEQIMMRS